MSKQQTKVEGGGGGDELVGGGGGGEGPSSRGGAVGDKRNQHKTPPRTVGVSKSKYRLSTGTVPEVAMGTMGIIKDIIARDRTPTTIIIETVIFSPFGVVNLGLDRLLLLRIVSRKTRTGGSGTQIGFFYECRANITDIIRDIDNMSIRAGILASIRGDIASIFNAIGTLSFSFSSLPNTQKPSYWVALGENLRCVESSYNI